MRQFEKLLKKRQRRLGRSVCKIVTRFLGGVSKQVTVNKRSLVWSTLELSRTMGFTLATRALCQGLGIKNLYLVRYIK